jgi:hypothetical protein
LLRRENIPPEFFKDNVTKSTCGLRTRRFATVCRKAYGVTFSTLEERRELCQIILKQVVYDFERREIMQIMPRPE